MSDLQQILINIADLMALLATRIKTHNAAGLYDLNNIAEDIHLVVDDITDHAIVEYRL